MSDISVGQVHSLLAHRRYAVEETGASGLTIREVESGLTIQAHLEGDILFFSIVCATVPAAKVTPNVMKKMLIANNGVATSSFHLHDAGGEQVTITLDNFCKLQEMGPDDEDDILSCVGFLLADVLHARDLIGQDLQ